MAIKDKSFYEYGKPPWTKTSVIKYRERVIEIREHVIEFREHVIEVQEHVIQKHNV